MRGATGCTQLIVSNIEKLPTEFSGQVEAFLLAFGFPGARISGGSIFLLANHHLMVFWATVEKAVILSFRAIVIRIGVVVVVVVVSANYSVC